MSRERKWPLWLKLIAWPFVAVFAIAAIPFFLFAGFVLLIIRAIDIVLDCDSFADDESGRGEAKGGV